MTRSNPLGATGAFPEGKLNEEDEGELRFAVGTENGEVVLVFNTPVAWMGMTPEQAVKLAGVLVAKAQMLTQ